MLVYYGMLKTLLAVCLYIFVEYLQHWPNMGIFVSCSKICKMHFVKANHAIFH